MKNILLTLFLALRLTSVGQNYIDYLNLANEAEHQFVEGKDIKIAKETFISLDKKYGGLLYKDNLYIGILYYIDNDSINGLKYLTKFVDLYGDLITYLPKCKKKFPHLYISQKTASDLENRQNKIGLMFKDSLTFKTKFKPTIDSIAKYQTIDQSNRGDNVKIDEALDFKTQTSYLNYLKKYGLPAPEIFGDDYLTVLFHIYDKQLIKMYLDFLLQQIEKGKACPFTYALVTDRGLYPETVYGAHAAKSSAKISDQNVIENRKKIGMSPYYNGPNNWPRIFPPEH